jgi:hypothetical protein
LTQLYQGLNTLDGFSLTAPIVSENGDGVGPLLQGKLSSIQFPVGAASPINFLQVPGSSSGADAGIPLKVVACVNCAGITDTLPDGGPILLPDGGPKPETLEIVPQLPLTERTQYAAYITTDLKDTSSKNVIPTAAFALTRSSAPLVDSNGKSTVSLLTDHQAQQLEPLRAGLKPLFETLASSGLPRKKIALGWAFTTQSTVSTLSQLHAAPTIANVPATPLWVADVTAQVVPVLDARGIPHAAVSAFWAGEIYDLFALSTGHFTPGLADAIPKKMPFVMVVPASAEPAGGYPVTIFGHGIFGDKTNVYAIANTLASIGHVAIAIDEPWHGDRNTCIGFGAFLNRATGQTTFTDKIACSNPGNQTCNAAGRCQLADQSSAANCTFASPTSDLGCLALGQGACAPDNKCEGTGAGFATSVGGVPVSGWNLLNLVDFFATRDNIRQQVISHAQLARVIATAGPAGIGPTGGSTTIRLDPTKISFVSQSVGSFLGSLYTAVAPEVGSTVLNVAGSDWILNLFTSPTFVPLRDAFIAGLAAQGIPKDSPTYDTFLGIAKWIIDPADPVNAGYYLTHSAKLPAPLPPNINPATRRAFVQWILDDQWVVNPGTVELVDASIGSLASDPTRIATPPFCDRHGFLLQPSDGVCTSPAGPPTPAGSALTAAGQGQVATFLSGAAPF